MALQDLTPQLRTRLSRMERAVGWFVFLATMLLLFGFGYYLKHTAERRGWGKIKAPFHTFVSSSAGLSVGDQVYIMGFSVGRITDIHSMPPLDPHNVYVGFEVVEPYFRHVWSQGSYVKINAAGFLNQRQLEVTRGTNGYAICVTQPVEIFTNLDDLKQLVAEQPGQWQLSQEILDENTNVIFRAYTFLNETNFSRIAESVHGPVYAYNNQEKDKNYIVASWHPKTHRYENFTPDDDAAWLHAVETPPVSDQLQGMLNQVQAALPNFLALTNQIKAVLVNAANAASNVNALAISAQPAATNANSLIVNLNTNMNSLLVNLNTNVNATLFNLADITSNLNDQVQANTNIVSWLSKTIVDSDDFVQGLKHHWLLRSAFKKENDAEAKAAAAAKAAAKTNSLPANKPTKP